MIFRRTFVAALAACAMLLAACGGDDADDRSHLVVDGAGDHATAPNSLGKKPAKPLAAGDVLGVRIDRADGEIRFRLGLAGSPATDVPTDPKSGPAWFVYLWAALDQTGPPAYVAAVVRDGEVRTKDGRLEGWRLSLCPGTTVCDEPAKDATLAIVGKEIRIAIESSAVEALTEQWAWTVQSYWNDSDDPLGAWSDYVPDAARPTTAGGFPAPNARGVFPPPRST